MNFQEANPQDETYWWVLDEDGIETIVHIEYTHNKEVRALYTGVEGSFDAKTIEYLSEIVRNPETSYNSEPHFNDPMLLKERKGIYDTKKVVDTIINDELNREKIVFADKLVALFPKTMTQTAILEKLENAVLLVKDV